ncbi:MULTISPECIES: chitobiase/beta-hexosaminidase C-terminal domain-containing protein [Clostridium]|uniref:chitobiase/beta-hexosaminidase C-terminal domain-containing protein n=1 Tax=Clostridium TaxID=1485 RepID=UPI0009BCA952|nr:MULTISPECIES: TIM-barrel domain-containing protein [Clostridium]PJI09778.1 alpha-glucosidase [Clostridium sp. CT7]
MSSVNKRPIWKKTLYCFVAAALVVNTVPQTLRLNTAADFNTSIKANSVKAASNISAKLTGDTLTITNGSDQTSIQICEPQLFRVDYKPGGKSSDKTLVVDPDKKWSTGNIVSSDLDSDPMVVTTKKMVLKISKSDLSISAYDMQGKMILKQNSVASKNVNFTHNSGDRFYGANGYNIKDDSSKGMIRNGNTPVYAGYQGHCGAPFIWSNDGYGVLVDSDGGNFSIEDTSLSYNGDSKTDTDYYVMLGNPKEVMSEESDVSGKAPMFPKWATGFTNTQWGWQNSLSGSGTDEDKLKSVINTYRSKQIPIDNFCLDFDWKQWGQDNYGEFKWNTDNFPSSESGQLKQYMDSKGLKLTGIMKPRVLFNSQQANYVASQNWWLPGDKAQNDYCCKKDMENVNFAIPELRTWWWNHIQDAFDKGIVGFWNDECDEDSNFGNFGNMNMERAIYDGQRGYKNQRVWSINRNYYSGAQRYAYGMWSGDIDTGFQSMANQRERMLSAVNLGEARWGMDTGGFNSGNPSSENYARWVEFSAFTPIFRVHGNQDQVRYPWAFGSTAESAAKKVMQLRYELMPYVYSYDRNLSQTGLGLVRSLMMEYPNDANTANDKEAWMFGDYMLVSPVVEQGQTSKNIYLPAGKWIDYNTGKQYDGGQTINYAVNSNTWDDVPIFMKSGAIIPTQDYEDYVGEKKITDVYVDAFPGTEASNFDYYDDDGNTYNYEKGSYFDQKMTLQKDNGSTYVEFNIGKNSGSYTPDLQNYIVKVHSKALNTVTSNGQALKQCSSYDELKNASGEGYATGTDKYGDVTYVKVAAGDAKDIIVPTTAEPASLTVTPSVKGGTYASAQNVSLTASRPGSTIYYTLDGTEPTENSTKYTAPITIDSNTTIKAIAVDAQGNKSDVDTENYTINIPLTASADLAEGTYYGAKTVTLTASKQNAVIYYTTDGTTPTSSSTKYTAPIILNPAKDSQTLKFIAVDAANPNNVSDVYTKVYNIRRADEGVTVHFKNPSGWGAPYVYYYDASGNKGANWPGIKMTSEGNGWYSYTIQGWTTAKVLFTDGTNQTPGKNQPGLDVTGEEWYENGIWYASNPDGLTAAASVKGGNYTSAQMVSLTATSSDATIYYTTDGTDPGVSSTKYTGPINIAKTTTLKFIAVDAKGNKSAIYTETYQINPVSDFVTVHFKNPSGWGAPYVYYYDASGKKGANWPGIKMISEGNGWYSYTIKNWTSAKVLFTDGRNQTPGKNQPGYDVTGEEWCENGTWYQSNPDANSIIRAQSASTKLGLCMKNILVPDLSFR